MELNKLIEEYVDINVNAPKYVDGTYRPKLEAFESYIESLSNSQGYIITLTEFNVFDLDNSIEYYIKQCNKVGKKPIKCISTIDNYLSVICKFMKYVNTNTIIKINRDLLDCILKWDSNEGSRNEKLEELRIKHNLEKRKPIVIWSKNDIERMHNEFNKLLKYAMTQKKKHHMQDYLNSILLG